MDGWKVASKQMKDAFFTSAGSAGPAPASVAETQLD